MFASVLRTQLRRPLVGAAGRMPAVAPVTRNVIRARGYATEAGGSSNTLLWVLGAAAAAGGGYWYYAAGSTDVMKKEAESAVKSASQAVKAATKFTPTKDDYQKVYNDIAELLDDNDYDDGSYGPVLVRLAWHSSGTYDKNDNTGGSNYATMRFPSEAGHGANAGLEVARTKIEEIKQKYPWMSYGDLWTLGGVCAVQEMQGPKIPWRPGRIDGFAKDATPDGRLPDASKAADHLRNIFYRMGFDDQAIVALSGAHALGRCHRNRSGFDGPWTFSPTTFTNDYFTLLMNERWTWRKWDGPKQLQDKTKTLMMLPSDFALVQDREFKKWVKVYAGDNDKFFSDFSKYFSELLELGVPRAQFVASEPWIMKTIDEQSS
ncbi:cytochrome c peroxidase [Dacryopinax primogenitus]|uniref:Peroxidase n=1 Tax=Dacryopinax primogenitus (strain DJM 731) TaxID=1858805 RepID=M5GFI4_DACPD|nr:cytochrome c peroxidase [Dacryopinax primogenitus]EJU04153.1 cytochrome c peroxidase [Dacryopinax primogenitus]